MTITAYATRLNRKTRNMERSRSRRKKRIMQDYLLNIEYEILGILNATETAPTQTEEELQLQIWEQVAREYNTL